MRKHLLTAFLGSWIIVIPFLPISAGSTQTLMLVATGLAVFLLGISSLRKPPQL